MYKWDEMNIQERDSLIADKVFSYVKQRHGEDFTWVQCDESGEVVEYQPEWFSPSRRISDAWEVIENVKNRLFSTRNKFMKELQILVSASSNIPIGQVIEWPDVFWLVTPDLICRAALEAVGIEIE